MPQRVISCHTALVGGYLIEGICRPSTSATCWKTAPDAVGLAVREMPLGSPGVGQGGRRKTYSVYLIRD